MKSEWKEYRIKDLLSFVVDNRGKTPEHQEEGYCLLEVNAVSETMKFPLYHAVRKHVSEEIYNTKFRKGHPQVGDVLVPTVGTLGAVSYMDRDDCCIAQNLIALRANSKICDSQFLYYTLRDPNIRRQLLNLDIGGVQPSIKVPHLMNLDVRVPKLKVQKEIGQILATIDDKIELNSKINDNLSALLQTIYQHRFGDESSTAVQGTLADICTYSKDRVPVSTLTVGNYYSTENMLQGKAGAVEATTLPTTPQTTACHIGDTLVSNIRPYFKKIVYCQNDCGCSTDVLCFSPIEARYSSYLFSTLYADRFFDFVMVGAKGTKMPRGDKQQIMTYPIAIPSSDELNVFNSVAAPILAQIRSNHDENKRLSALRDTLLPKLMSGEIDVGGLEL